MTGWLNALGNYLSNISWRDALQALYRVPWNTVLGALGTAGALGSTLYGYSQAQRAWREQARLARQREAEIRARVNQLAAAGARPLDISQYYTPLSEAAKDALLRGLHSNIAARGIQPGGYYDAMTAELLARTEADRYQRAAELAAQARAHELDALRGGISAIAGAPMPPPRPGFPVIGDFGALGKALQYEQARRAHEAARARRRNFEDQLLQATGYSGTTPYLGSSYSVLPGTGGEVPYVQMPMPSGTSSAATPMPNPYTTWGYGGDVFTSPWGPYD